MDRSYERQKPLPFNRNLTSLIRSSMFAARVMGHPEINIGHVGICLDDQHAEFLTRSGINQEVFRDALPKQSSDLKPVISNEVRDFLSNASSRARYNNSKEVTVQHLLDAMTDPGNPVLMIFKFTRLKGPVPVIRRGRESASYEAA